ncbi:MAG: CtsR family transcriptional regulator [Dethiobacteria bacterium]|jgi:transcriptional regulator CtsR
MSSLANKMEDYLKKLLSLSASGYIDIKRKELSNKFSCVPSQVNYVLETRFTMEKGYLVESKRGGKGFVRIKKLDAFEENHLAEFFQEILTDYVSDARAKGFVQRLYEEKYISLREAKIMEASLNSIEFIEDDLLKNKLRTCLLKDMFLMLLKFAF